MSDAFSGISASASPMRLGWAGVQSLCKIRLNAMVLATAAIGYLLAGGWSAGPGLMLLMLAGLGWAAVGGSILNQYLERDVDAIMTRTAGRALPTGLISPMQALLAGTACASVGLLILTLLVEPLAGLLCALTLVSYLFFYTPLKRRSPLSTVVGAVPGALPPMIGWVSAGAGVERGAWAIFAILVAWQLPHFFAIGWMYRSDYLRAGMPIMAAMDDTGWATAQHMVMCCLNLLFVSLMPVAMSLAGWVYFWLALAGGLGFLATTVRFARQRSFSTARTVLLASLVYLPLVLSAWVMDNLLAS